MKQEVSENKMDFIVCYNDALYMRECQRYIENLHVPENMSIEVLGISDADSMCAGYQAAMMESDAKYKVYLHQDLFIINKNFISDVIKIFQEEKEYGMLGVMGSAKMHANARYWDHWDIGETFASMSAVSGIAWRRDVVGQVEPVVAVDGMIMITQYDVNWREDIFTGFDFYDISQCMEFARAGYKVGVVHQETPWCMHDCGHSKFDNYEINRKKFCETYQMLGYTYEEDAEMVERVATKKQLDICMIEVEEAFERNAYVEAIKLVQEVLKLSMYHTKCCYYSVILEILMEECRVQKPIFSFSKSYSPKDLLLEYQKLRLLIMRLEFGLAIDDYAAEWEWARRLEHMQELDIIIRHTALQVEAVQKLMQDVYCNVKQ